MSEFEATRAQAVPQPPQPPGFAADGDLFPTRNGRYRQVGDAKPGGMGLVYRAFDQELEIEVAIKRILPERLGDDASRQRFRLEARAQRSCVASMESWDFWIMLRISMART